MGILSNIFASQQLKIQKRELEEFIEILSGMDDEEVEKLFQEVMLSKHTINKEFNILADDPWFTLQIKPDVASELNSLIRIKQKNNKLVEAASLKVWLFTFRASIRIELRKRTKDLWLELYRGMCHEEKFFPDGFVPNEIKYETNKKYIILFRVLNDILNTFIKTKDYGLPVLVRAEADAIFDFMYVILKQQPLENIINLAHEANTNKKTIREYSLKLIALEMHDGNYLTSYNQYKLLHDYMKIKNILDKWQYIATYQKVGREFQLSEKEVTRALILRKILSPNSKDNH